MMEFNVYTVVLAVLVLFVGLVFLRRGNKGAVKKPPSIVKSPIESPNERIPKVPTPVIPREEQEPVSPIESLLRLTRTELLDFNGENGKPIYAAFQGDIYDLSPAAKYYGPGEPWHALAGHSVEVALGKQSISAQDLTDTKVSFLTRQQILVMERWKLIFDAKYKVVGRLAEECDEEP